MCLVNCLYSFVTKEAIAADNIIGHMAARSRLSFRLTLHEYKRDSSGLVCMQEKFQLLSDHLSFYLVSMENATSIKSSGDQTG
jgi:hypothetical protein